MDAWYVWVPITVALLVASGFFVVIEFAFMAAQQHRLEAEATTSRTARAALYATNHLTVMLAGAQLGITACTFALGSISEPQMHHVLEHVFHAAEIPSSVSTPLSFILALLIITFLHLVVGEMSPKAWAVSDPERAAKMVAVPANAFVAVFRPLLNWINNMANKIVAKLGEEPSDKASAKGYNRETLRNLLQHSKEEGALDEGSADHLENLISLEEYTVSDAIDLDGVGVEDLEEIAMIPADATVQDAHDSVRETGHLRLVVRCEQGPRVMHVRDTLRMMPDEGIDSVTREAFYVDARTSVSDAMERMRENREQFALVRRPDSETIIGVFTWDDIMHLIWPATAEADGV